MTQLGSTKQLGSWEYWTSKQRDREKTQQWLSMYAESSRHVSYMEPILLVYRNHRGLLNEDAFTFASHGILAMHQYMTVDKLIELQKQIDTLIKEKQNDERYK